MSGTGKHILYIPRWYPSEIDPMLGLFVRNHALATTYAGYTVSVAYPVPTKERVQRKKRISVTSENNLTEVIAYYPEHGILKGVLQLIAWYRCISQAVKINGRPDVVHAHILTRTAVIAWIVAHYYGITYIITEHWSRYFPENLSYKGFLRKRITAFVINNAQTCSVVSRRLYNAMNGQGLLFPFKLLPNVVDTSLFSITENRSQRFRFINISCFEERSKNLKLLIVSANKLRKMGYDFDLMFVGDGADRKKTEEYCNSTGLNAIFTGTLSQEKTATILKESHCLVITSNYETFGIVAFESLASGVPVITTNVADLSDIINTENGVIIQDRETDTLVSAMKDVYEGYDRYNPEKIRAQVHNFCSIKAVSGILDEIYQKAIIKS